MILKNGNVLLEDGFVRADVRFERTVEAVAPGLSGGEAFDAGDGWVLPGLVDIHTHGAVGGNFLDGDPAGLERMRAYYAARGVTGVLATASTAEEGALERALTVLREAPKSGGAKLLGVHLEGPFLSHGKRGAQDPRYLLAPDLDRLRRWNEVSGGMVKMVTVAPELDGAIRFIRGAAGEFTISLGHTCADYDTAMKAFEAGACHVTHLYNGMEPPHHRAPGLLAAARDAGAVAELICDGLHVHPAMVRLSYELFRGRMALISDSVRCAGLPDGEYEQIAGRTITVKDGRAVLKGTDTLAGSCISVLDALRRAVRFGIPLPDAARAATSVPARSVGLDDAGRIAPGLPADLIVLDRELELRAVFIDGVPFKLA